MDKYMKKSDVIAYIRKEAKEAQSAFDELGGESGIISEAFEDLANELEDFPAVSVPQWISVKDRLPDVAGMYEVNDGTAQNESHGYGRQARGNPAKTEAHVQAQGRAASSAGSRAENDLTAASCGNRRRRETL